MARVTQPLGGGSDSAKNRGGRSARTSPCTFVLCQASSLPAQIGSRPQNRLCFVHSKEREAELASSQGEDTEPGPEGGGLGISSRPQLSGRGASPRGPESGHEEDNIGPH